ncbi:MAG: hypothetical protein V4708_18950 [Bacteroidota bacterium]
MKHIRISAGMLVIYVLMLTLDARGQAFTDPLFVRPGQTVHSTHLVEKVRKIYTSQIGVREKGNNSGKEVEEYLKYVKLVKGNPWCAAFVCWVFGRADIANPRTGWSPGLFGEGRVIWRNGEQGTKNKEQRFGSRKFYNPVQNTVDGINPDGGIAYPTSLTSGFRLLTSDPRNTRTRPQKLPTPNTGDVFGLYFPEKGRIAHVGFIDEWKDPWVVTVEGNTNVLGSREGDGVYRKRRLVRTVSKVARYVE